MGKLSKILQDIYDSGLTLSIKISRTENFKVTLFDNIKGFDEIKGYSRVEKSSELVIEIYKLIFTFYPKSDCVKKWKSQGINY